MLDLRRDPGGVSFVLGPAPGATVYPDDVTGQIGPIDVPDSYTSPFRYIENRRVEKEGGQYYCSFCHFRPWADTSDVAQAVVTVVRRDGRGRATTSTVPAQLRDGRWFAEVSNARGTEAYVDRGGVKDNYGNFNGERSTSWVRPRR